MHVTSSTCIPASTPVACWCRFDPPSRQHFDFNFVNRINCFCDDVAIFFSCIMSLLLVLVSKLKWQRRHLRFSNVDKSMLI